MGMFGLYSGSFMLTAIAVLVFIGATQELLVEKSTLAAKGKFARDFLVPLDKLFVFNHGTTIQKAMRIGISSPQTLFPVIYQEKIMGVISRDKIIEAATNIDYPNEYISGLINKEYLSVLPTESIEKVLETANNASTDSILVVEQEKLIGLIYTSQVSELLVLDSFRGEIRKLEEDESNNFNID